MKLDVWAFTITVAVIWTGVVLLVGLANLIWPGYGQSFLDVVASVYPGYQVDGSFGQVIIGSLYALVDSLVVGAIFALIYNLIVGRRTAE